MRYQIRAPGPKRNDRSAAFPNVILAADPTVNRAYFVIERKCSGESTAPSLAKLRTPLRRTTVADAAQSAVASSHARKLNRTDAPLASGTLTRSKIHPFNLNAAASRSRRRLFILERRQLISPLRPVDGHAATPRSGTRI